MYLRYAVVVAPVVVLKVSIISGKLAFRTRPLDDRGRSSQRSIRLKIIAVRTIESVREQWTAKMSEC